MKPTLVSVTKVELTRDLGVAKILVAISGRPQGQDSAMDTLLRLRGCVCSLRMPLGARQKLSASHRAGQLVCPPAKILVAISGRPQGQDSAKDTLLRLRGCVCSLCTTSG